MKRHPFAIYAITKHGLESGKTLLESLPDAHLYVSKKFEKLAPEGSKILPLPFSPLLKETFPNYDCHIFIISVGAVVRMVAPYLVSKKTDPAVICIDDAAKFSICVLSGHVGRGNEYTDRVADALQCTSVVTTASDRLGTLTVDILGRDLGWVLDDPDRNVTMGCAAVVNEEKVMFIQEAGETNFWPKPLPKNISYTTDIDKVDPNDYGCLLIASDRDLRISYPQHFEKSVIYRPKSLIIGMGCDKGTPLSLLRSGLLSQLKSEGIDYRCIRAIATIDLKKDEPGLVALAAELNVPLLCSDAETLDAVDGIENPSEVVRKFVGCRAVAEAAALHWAGASKLLVSKRKYTEASVERNMTLAVARVAADSY